MPTKKSKQTVKQEESFFDLQKFMQNSDSYKSLIYGIVTVVVLFIVIALGVRALQQNKALIDEEALSTYNLQPDINNKPESHNIVEGESLWSIAEKYYGDGAQWVLIAKANNISNPSAVVIGSTIMIPRLEQREAVMQAQPSGNPATAITVQPTATPTLSATMTPTTGPTTTKLPTVNKTTPTVVQPQTNQGSAEKVSGAQNITGGSYAVVRGDTLWDIAQRAYGDPYKWIEIAKANRLVNPDIIHAGNVMNLPR